MGNNGVTKSIPEESYRRKMNDFEMTGTVLHVGETQKFSEKFQKRILELETGSDWPQINEFQFTNDRTAALDDVIEGDVINIKFQLRGREWIPNDGRPRRVFNELNGSSVEMITKANPVQHGEAYQTVRGGVSVEIEGEPVEEKHLVTGPPLEPKEPIKDDIPF